jgi:site-specific DNA recombinase
MKTNMKPAAEYVRAIIYPRVSSERQVNEGTGLESQAYRCIQYAESLGLKVAETFKDEGVSGALLQRPGFKSLLTFLDSHAEEKFIVVIDDISRLARDLKVYLQLKTELTKRGAMIKSPNFNFEDTPEGIFIENIIASKAQLDRQQNKRQVMQKMKACLERGRWAFNPPPGLKNVKGMLQPVEPFATIYRDAIKKYASFELNTFETVQRFILSQYREHGIQRTLSLSGAIRILKNPLYCGYMEYQPWGISLRKAEHAGFISYQTFCAVQNRIANVAKPRLRKDYSEDFPVRGYALCEACKKPFTAAWFKGKQERFPYYLCKTIGCPLKNKMTPKTELEDHLVNLLGQSAPQPDILDLVGAVLSDTWQSRQSAQAKLRLDKDRQIAELEAQNKTYFQRIGKTTSDTIVAGYEQQIEDNEKQIANLKQDLRKVKYNQKSFQTTTKVVLDYIKNPVEQWESGKFYKLRLLLGMYFGDKVVYEQKAGFQTPELPLILAISRDKTTTKNDLVEMPRVKLGSSDCHRTS